MTAPEFSDDQKIRFMAVLFGYTLSLVALLCLAGVVVIRAWPMLLQWGALVGCGIMVAMTIRHLCSAANPLDSTQSSNPTI